MNKVKLYWMKGSNYSKSGKKNFGDWLSFDIVSKFSSHHITWSSAKKADMLAIGSIATRINKLSFLRIKPLYVWGSGTGNYTIKKHRSLKVYATRGALSNSLIAPQSELPHGDPGLLASEIWTSSSKNKKVAVILNEGDLKQSKYIPKCFDIIPPFGEPEEIIKLITKYDFVISSSLHGLVIADSYGIPSRWLKINLDSFKFEDYYSAYKEYKQLPPLSIDVLHKINLSNIDSFFNLQLPQITEVKKQLIESFPKELL